VSKTYLHVDRHSHFYRSLHLERHSHGHFFDDLHRTVDSVGHAHLSDHLTRHADLIKEGRGIGRQELLVWCGVVWFANVVVVERQKKWAERAERG
jgi:hypothetical protein